MHNLSGNDKWEFNNSDVEIDVDINGELTLTGYPEDQLLTDLVE